MNRLPEPPVPPEDWECCGSECGAACVYEIYRREKAAYEAARQAECNVGGSETADSDKGRNTP